MCMVVLVRSKNKSFIDGHTQVCIGSDQLMIADVVAVSPADIIWAPKTKIFTKEIFHFHMEIQIIAVCSLCDSKEWILAQGSSLHIPGFPLRERLVVQGPVDLASSLSFFLDFVINRTLFREINGAISQSCRLVSGRCSTVSAWTSGWSNFCSRSPIRSRCCFCRSGRGCGVSFFSCSRTGSLSCHSLLSSGCRFKDRAWLCLRRF